MKNKAVFLDRDGVIIEDFHHKTGKHLSNISEIRFLRGAAKAIQKLNAHFLVIVVANQSSVARGLVSMKQAREINAFIRKELQKKGCRIDAVYFCPHHPDFSGECDCRKPKTGLLLQAQKEFEIDFKNSFMVGDKTSDIAAGKKAGCKTILVKTGYGGKDSVTKEIPDIVAQDLGQATEWILRQSKKVGDEK